MENQKESITSLVLGKREYVLEHFATQLARFGLKSKTYTDSAAVIKQIMTDRYPLVIIAGGVDPNSRIMLKEYVTSHKPEVRIIEHYGGPATLVEELKDALGADMLTA